MTIGHGRLPIPRGPFRSLDSAQRLAPFEALCLSRARCQTTIYCPPAGGSIEPHSCSAISANDVPALLM
jgi:hypothetical protein